MTWNLILVVGLLLFVGSRVAQKTSIGSRGDLRWWQKPAVWLVVLAALLIIATPEFFALGLIGDSTFFDLLVVLLSLQFRDVLLQMRCWLGSRLSRFAYWFFAPRVTYLLLLATWMTLVDVISWISAAWHGLHSGLGRS